MSEGSIMRHARNESNSSTNRIAIGISILSIVLLAIMIVTDRQQNKTLGESLAQLAQQQNAEEQAFLDMVDAEYDADKAVLHQYFPGIVCWGDSLTAGAGGNGVTYPKVLSSLIQKQVCDPYDLKSYSGSKHSHLIDSADYTLEIPVINMGVGGETSITIAGRNGAIPYILSEALTIPSGTTPVEIHFTSKGGEYVAPLRQGQSGVNSVTIGGIEGTLSIIQNTWESKEYSYTFTRMAAGEIKTVPAGTEIITAASSQYLDYITVIFIGQNGGYRDFDDLILQQRAIIDHQTSNNDRFIIVGLHTGTKESRAALEEAMKKEYGGKYINLREYMSTHAMDDAGLEPTEEDILLMEKGATPASLLCDEVHFTPAGYALIGELIYKTMDSLGYFDEVRDALTHNFD